MHEEQGFGDIIQFSRDLLELKEIDGTVVVQVRTRFIPLMRSMPIDFPIISHIENPGVFDVQAPVISLSHLLKIGPPHWPGQGPYLFAEPGRVAMWRARLAQIPGVKVVVSWKGAIVA